MQITYSSLGNTIERERERPFVLYRKRRQCKYLKQKRRKTKLLPNLFGKTREGNRMLFPTYEKKTGDESEFSISGHYFCGLLLKFRSPPPSCEGRCMPKNKKTEQLRFSRNNFASRKKILLSRNATHGRTYYTSKNPPTPPFEIPR